MKRIALLFSVCLAVSVWAGNGNTVSPFGNNLKSEPLKLKMKIQQPAERVGINRQERSVADVKAKMVSESQHPQGRLATGQLAGRGRLACIGKRIYKTAFGQCGGRSKLNERKL